MIMYRNRKKRHASTVEKKSYNPMPQGGNRHPNTAATSSITWHMVEDKGGFHCMVACMSDSVWLV